MKSPEDYTLGPKRPCNLWICQSRRLVVDALLHMLKPRCVIGYDDGLANYAPVRRPSKARRLLRSWGALKLRSRIPHSILNLIQNLVDRRMHPTRAALVMNNVYSYDVAEKLTEFYGVIAHGIHPEEPYDRGLVYRIAPKIVKDVVLEMWPDVAEASGRVDLDLVVLGGGLYRCGLVRSVREEVRAYIDLIEEVSVVKYRVALKPHPRGAEEVVSMAKRFGLQCVEGPFLKLPVEIMLMKSRIGTVVGPFSSGLVHAGLLFGVESVLPSLDWYKKYANYWYVNCRERSPIFRFFSETSDSFERR